MLDEGAEKFKSRICQNGFYFLVNQGLLVDNSEKPENSVDNTKEDENSGGNLYYPTNRFRALIENYFDEYKGRFTQILSKGEKNDATD